MSEKKKKNTWSSWALCAVVFLAIVFFLLFSFMSKGKDVAVSEAEYRISYYAETWAGTLADRLKLSENYGSIINSLADDTNTKIKDSQMIFYVAEVAKNTDYYTILICDENGIICDEAGNEKPEVDYSQILKEDVLSKPGYYLLEDDQMGNENSFMVSYPLENAGGYVLFLSDISKLSKELLKSGYEDTSFAVIFKKDGTIVGKLTGFKDVDSSFLKAENFLDALREGCEKRELYNIFKAKLYNNNTCTLASTYENDSRTISCAHMGLDDWYVAYGVRQYQVDILTSEYYDSVKNTAVKLVIVLTIFTVFIVGTVVFNLIKSAEKGKKLENKADTDLLTELTNKVATERMIGEYMSDFPEKRGVLFIIDIDNFKKVNDTMGHAFGDTLLKTLGKEIRAEFRVTDIVGRTGGDEFMIFLKDIKDDLIVEREANRLSRFFHEFKAGGDYVKYSATASIGAAIFPDDGKEFKDLYVSADQALYRAKKRGKNQLVFYNEEKYGTSKQQ